MQNRDAAKQALSRIVPARQIGPYVGPLGNHAHVYVVAPSRRAVVSERTVVVYSAKGEPTTYALPSTR